MDSRLKDAVLGEDIAMIKELIKEDKSIIEQRDLELNTVLHLAAKHGHVESASEVVRIHPDMVTYENIDQETPIHVACRAGQLQMVKLFLDSESNTSTEDSVYKVNCHGQTALFAACESGRDEVAKYLIEYFPKLLKLEKDATIESSLHIASSSDYTDIVRELLKARPSFAWKKNLEGKIPLHLACINGHLGIVTEFLQLDDDLCVFKDDKGRTPLHFAVSNGHIDVIAEIISANPESADIITEKEENIFHLAVKHKQFKLVEYLMEAINNSQLLLNLPNKKGDTVLHLQSSRNIWRPSQAKQSIYAMQLILGSGVNVNALNHKGESPLDGLVASHARMSFRAQKHISALHEELKKVLKEAGGKLSDELTQRPADYQRLPSKTLPRKNKKENRSHDRHISTNRKELQNEGLRNA